MANELDIPQLEEGQASPEVTTNDATAALGDAVANQFLVDLTSGNVSITAAQYRSAVFFNCANVGTSGRTVTVPEVEREFTLFECPAANTNTISLIRGSTTLTLSPGRVYLVRTDGTANGLVARDIGGVSEPSDHAVFFPGLFTVNNQLMFRRKVLRAFTLPANLAGSFGSAGVASTGTKVVDIKKAGSSVATITFTTSATGTLATSGGTAQSFAVGDVLTIVGPATPDATLADISIDLFGTR